MLLAQTEYSEDVVINEIIVARFNERVVKQKGCWGWKGSKDVYGYGYVSYLYKKLKAHRVSYQIYKSEIPSGLVLDHICRNRFCVNPAHLEPVTIGENVKRGYSLDTHCRHGHLMNERNRGVRYAYGREYPKCTECLRIRARERYHRVIKPRREQAKLSDV